MDSEAYGKFEKLLHVSVMGRQLEMPENNTILRGLQFVAPHLIPYGRFCWNGDCKNCVVTIRNGEGESTALACKLDVCDGMDVTSASAEIQNCLTRAAETCDYITW
jgi:hypothetical protein